MGNKMRFNTYLDEDAAENMEYAMQMVDVNSASEFIRNAVEFYIGYIFQNQNADYLSPIITRTMKEIQYGYEKNLSKMLFKLAVEIAKVNHITVDSIDWLDNEYLRQINAVSCAEVAANNGVLHIENTPKEPDPYA